MTPIYLDSSPSSPFPAELNEDQNHNFLSPNSQASSSSSLSFHVFFNSNTHDQTEYFHREQIQSLPHQQEGDNFGSQAYDDDHHVENEINGSNTNSGLKFSIWKKEITNDQNQVKWMSSKMRLMLKMKKPDPTDTIIPNHSTTTSTAPVVVKVEEDNSSNSPSNNNHNNPIIRVCSDCNTTKTPLWRSGPRGPKSLCNACGIRQRKARRAMAAAAENGTILPVDQTTPMKSSTKIQHKDHKKKNSGHVTKYKKRQCNKLISTSPAIKNCFEDFLVSLSKNLTFHSVFPQDEKEAAILLMAISCGYVHG